MTPEEIAVAFRKSELQRREVRRKVILNHAALEEEVLSPEDALANEKALAVIRKGQEEFLRATRPVEYWLRVWWALKELWRALKGEQE